MASRSCGHDGYDGQIKSSNQTHVSRLVDCRPAGCDRRFRSRSAGALPISGAEPEPEGGQDPCIPEQSAG